MRIAAGLRLGSPGAVLPLRVLLLLGAASAGCASSALQVHDYILEPTASQAAAPATAPVSDPLIAIGPIDVPDYLKRPEIVSRGPGGRVEVRASDRWGEDLESGLARVLAGDLARLVPSTRVVREPFAAAVQPAFAIAVQIRSFEAMSDGNVDLEAHWVMSTRLQPPASTPVGERVERTAIREPIEEGSTEGRVAAMSRAVARLAEPIAEAIRAALDRTAAVMPPARSR